MGRERITETYKQRSKRRQLYFTDDLHATLYDPGTPFKMASAVQWTQQKGRASGKRRPWHSKSQGNGGHAFLQRDTYFDSTLANSRLHSPNLSPFELVTRRLSPRTSSGPKGRAPRDRNRLPEERGRGSERRSGVDRAARDTALPLMDGAARRKAAK